MSTGDQVATYRVDGDHVVPLPFAAGPWSADHQHGAAVAGLLTRALDRVPSAQPMRLARVTIDLTRPVPMRPCVVEARALRDGRRVQSLEAVVTVDGTAVARAVATRIRVQSGLVPAHLVPPPPPGDEAPPMAATRSFYALDRVAFHESLEIRDLDVSDPTRPVTWYRLEHPLVEGEDPSPVVRLGATADYVMGGARILGAGWTSINPELSFQVEREPVGEWICVASTIRLRDDGMGTSEGVLYDEVGRIGRSSKTMLIDPTR
jgi:acyl-coenzyme A thioesterase PaaI-like protein